MTEKIYESGENYRTTESQFLYGSRISFGETTIVGLSSQTRKEEWEMMFENHSKVFELAHEIIVSGY